ncbi:GNAT family N-acetyltransferase [Rhodopseudomonas palustris]|uniref:GNAT family N-acetyltransferase n=1 Tax=Rhodopseudomonas palustris TaxID=1076 RepID=A0A418V266_RHOPL|nr:GNAT family N-acetyltransferase [Rhodopseudomonas palustris]RJF69998.1 GNAT family N-acetyltransferase [Rhodopseudomonas palustris]
MYDALIADLTGSKGTIRSLINQELPLLRDHLLRLDAESRRDRFNGYADEGFIDRYARKCGGDGTIIIAFFGEDGAVHAAAELHQPDSSTDRLPEIAFSVEAHLRRKGIGSILFRQLMEVARSLGYENLRITTGAQNQAMRALANKFGAHLTFRQGESTGTIDLNQDASTANAPTIEIPAGAASALIDFNQACWNLFLRMSGLGRAA